VTLAIGMIPDGPLPVRCGRTRGGNAATFTVIANDATQLVAWFFDGQSMNSLTS
jgi:hypothetical protein